MEVIALYGVLIIKISTEDLLHMFVVVVVFFLVRLSSLNETAKGDLIFFFGVKGFNLKWSRLLQYSRL